MTISCFRTFLIFIQSYILNFCIYFKCFFLYIYICIQKKIVIERTRDLIYLKCVATDFSPKITSPSTGENPVTQRSPCYSAVSALLMNPLPDRSNYSPLCHTHYLTPPRPADQYFIVSSGQTLYQAASWRLILQSSLLQRFTAESSQELSALRKLNNKQRQVSMFLFKFLIQFPFLSFLSISILSLLPFSILSLLPSPSLLSLLINSLSS